MAMRKLNKDDYKIGQQVALKYVNNMARYDKDGYRIGNITKLGNKYLYVDSIAISMESGYEKTNYSPDYQLYDSEQHLLDEMHKEKLLFGIRNELGNYGTCEISYNKIKEIAEILELQ